MNISVSSQSERPKIQLGSMGIISALLSVLFFVGGFYLASSVEISSAVIASGKAVVRGNPKSIQHLDGGIVAEIHVTNGDLVKKGQPLIAIDDTLLNANMDIYQSRLSDALALRDRLLAEQLGSPNILFTSSDPLISGLDRKATVQGQKAIFRTRHAVRDARKERLREKIRQFENQKNGTNFLINSKVEQLRLTKQEIKAIKILVRKKLSRKSQMLGLQRTQSEIAGQIGENKSELARMNNSIRDAELELISIDHQVSEEASESLRDVNNKIGELVQQALTTQIQKSRTRVLAPISGFVHELQVFIEGAIIPSGGTILQIIPSNDGLVFETKVAPISIDQVFLGQDVRVTFPGLAGKNTPEAPGKVTFVSADIVEDQRTGNNYYKVIINITTEELEKITDVTLVPGMPIEAFLQTGERTILSYLTKPMMQHFEKMFREL